MNELACNLAPVDLVSLAHFTVYLLQDQSGIWSQLLQGSMGLLPDTLHITLSVFMAGSGFLNSLSKNISVYAVYIKD